MAGLNAKWGFAAGADGGSAGAAEKFEQRVRALELASGGRLGVAYLDTGSGVRGGYRQGERFPMCSTFKLLLAGAVLRRVDEGKEQLGRVVHYGRDQLMSYSPVTGPQIADGMTVSGLCAAAMTMSDNTAANLLLASLGGPSGVTSFVRTLGDDVTRLDRTEPDLNESIPGDPRDTTAPEKMIADLRKLILGKALSADSTKLLVGWLVGCKTGDKRVRAGVPAGWTVGDKTGTGPRGTANDVAVLWPEGRAAILVAVYLTGATGDAAKQEETLAEAARAVVGAV